MKRDATRRDATQRNATQCDATRHKAWRSQRIDLHLAYQQQLYLVCFLLINVVELLQTHLLCRVSGWTGLALIILGALVAGYCGILLSRCWTMMLERYPEARRTVRRPYPMIAEKAIGKWMG